jgi:aspartate aminotransferase-like enzyme
MRKTAKGFNTQEDVLVLNGEGILGLEAAVVNAVEPEIRCWFR